MLLRICLLLLLLTSCNSSNHKGKKEAKVIPVIAELPEVRDVPLYIEAIGLLQPSATSDIYSQVEGELEEILVAEGEVVSPGTPLVRIDGASYRLRVKEAESAKSASIATFLAAEKKLVRLRHLLEKDLISQNDWDLHEMEVEKAKAAVLMCEAKLASAELDLNRCTLCSPISGRVGKIDIHPGYSVTKSQKSLLSIVKQDPLLVEFMVTEKEVPALKDTQKVVTIPLSSLETKKTAEITFMDNQFDPKTGLILVRALLPNAEGDLKPGQSVRVQIPSKVLLAQTLIPQKAIRYNDQGAYVYLVLSDETAALKQVKMGEEVEKKVIILEGLELSDRVVTEGHLRLSRGAKVSFGELE